MANIIIADSSSLIALQNVQRLALLTDVYQELIVPNEVAREFGEPLPMGF